MLRNKLKLNKQVSLKTQKRLKIAGLGLFFNYLDEFSILVSVLVGWIWKSHIAPFSS